MRDERPDLWRDGDFLKLWLGETISVFGSQITTLALPLTAALILDASPVQIGALGAALAPAFHRRGGIGPALLTSYLFGCLSPLIVPLAAGPRPVLIATLVAGFFLMNAGSSASQVYVWSLRQSLVPAEVLGRMNAAYRCFVTGMVPIGASLGVALAGSIGLRPTLLVAALGGTLALGWVFASPLPRLRALPGEASAGEPTMIAEVA